jgi:hypothetical protein
MAIHPDDSDSFLMTYVRTGIKPKNNNFSEMAGINYGSPLKELSNNKPILQACETCDFNSPTYLSQSAAFDSIMNQYSSNNYFIYKVYTTTEHIGAWYNGPNDYQLIVCTSSGCSTGTGTSFTSLRSSCSSSSLVLNTHLGTYIIGTSTVCKWIHGIGYCFASNGLIVLQYDLACSFFRSRFTGYINSCPVTMNSVATKSASIWGSRDCDSSDPTNPPASSPTNPPAQTPTNPPASFPTNPPATFPTNPPVSSPTEPPTTPSTSHCIGDEIGDSEYHGETCDLYECKKNGKVYKATSQHIFMVDDRFVKFDELFDLTKCVKYCGKSYNIKTNVAVYNDLIVTKFVHKSGIKSWIKKIVEFLLTLN